MAKSSACGALSKEWEMHARDGGSAKATVASYYGHIVLCQKQFCCFHSAHNSTPYEIFFGGKPNLSDMQLFGCQAFVLTEDKKELDSNDQTGSLWATRTEASVMKMDFPSESRARCGNQGTRLSTWTASQEPLHQPTQTCLMIDAWRRLSILHYDTGLHDVKNSPDVEQPEVADRTNVGHLQDEDDNTQPQRSELGRQRRNVRQPRRLDDFVMGDGLQNLALHSEALVASTVPGSASQALADLKWKAEMHQEYNLLMTNEVWSLISRPTERQPFTGKWHYA